MFSRLLIILLILIALAAVAFSTKLYKLVEGQEDKLSAGVSALGFDNISMDGFDVMAYFSSDEGSADHQPVKSNAPAKTVATPVAKSSLNTNARRKTSAARKVSAQKQRAYSLNGSANVVRGMDWSHDLSTSPVAGMGVYDASPISTAKKRAITLSWAQINPAYGVYDYSMMSQAIEQGAEIYVRFNAHRICDVPDWVQSNTEKLSDGSLPFWSSTYRNDIDSLLKDFADKWGAHKQFIGMQLSLGSGECNGGSRESAGGGLAYSKALLAEAEDDFGLTENVFEQGLFDLLTQYKRHFGNNVNKVALPNLAMVSVNTPKYNKALLAASTFALKNGFGMAATDINDMMLYSQPIYGNVLNSNVAKSCHVSMSERFKEQLGARLWAADFDASTVNQDDVYGFMLAMLRGMQMNARQVVFDAAKIKRFENKQYQLSQFTDYLTANASSIDKEAFIVLGQYPLYDEVHGADPQALTCLNDEGALVGSFGYGLRMESASQAAEMQLKNDDLRSGKGPHYLARSAYKMNFNVDDELVEGRCTGQCQLTIRIGFADNVASKMTIKTSQGSIDAKRTVGKGGIRTAVFSFNSELNNSVDGSDFILEMDNDLPVYWVRLSLK